jgi:integral membrane sensor domain MASE1
MSLHTWTYLMHVAFLAALYVGTAKLGLSLHAVGGFAPAVWPPTGVALVALVIGGYRLWPGIALGASLINVWAGAPLLVTAAMALGNTLETLLGAAFLRHVVRLRPALDRLRDVAGLVDAALLSTLVSAMVGVRSGWFGGVIATDVYDKAWRTWWLGDMNGDLVVAGLLLTWSTRPKTIILSRLLLEGAGLLLTVVTLGLLVFTRSMATDIIDFSYLVSPVLIWAALRYGPPGASAITAVVSSLAIWGTFRRQPEGKLQLQVGDNGVGLPDAVTPDTVESFGLQLVDILREQLRATLELQRHPGTTVTITFTELTFQSRS